MDRTKTITGMMALLACGMGFAQADEPKGKTGFATASPMCPVMEEPISFFSTTMTDDGPVYFCCDDCIEKYNKNPQKYAAKVEVQRAALVKLDKVQVRCPISGKPADPKVTAQHNGQKVSFCCPGCVGRFEKDPAKYAAALAASYSYQTRCPVMGGKIDPQSFTELPTGETIFYCCIACDKKLRDDPAKYNKNLAAQGINVDWAKVKSKKEEHAKDDGHGHEGHDHH